MNIDAQALIAAKKVVPLFFPDQALLEIQAYGSGHIHRTFHVQLVNQKQFILQQVNTSIFKNPLAIGQNILHLTRHLKNSDYPFALAEPILTTDQRFLYTDPEGASWRMFSFLHPTHSFDRVEHPVQAFAAARAFGIFSKKISTLSPTLLQEGIPNFHNCKFRHQQLQETMQKNPHQRLKYSSQEINFLHEHSYCREWRSRRLPVKLSHNDTKISNILFQSDGQTPLAIIDLDTVMLASPLYDFGDMVRTFTSPALEDAPEQEVTMRLDVFKALSEGFAEGTSDFLEASERASLLLGAFLMVQVQAQRFLNDYLNGDVYYPIQYPDHNLVRGKNQLALLKSMLAQQREMEKIIELNFKA